MKQTCDICGKKTDRTILTKHGFLCEVCYKQYNEVVK